jgi:hypothetical protein
VAGGAAGVRGESEDPGAVEDGGGARGEVGRDDDAGFGKVAEVLFGGAAQKMVKDAPADIADVSGPFAEVVVAEFAEGAGELLDDLMVGGLGVDVLFADELMDFGEHHLVFEDEKVGVEEAGFVGAKRFGHLALDVEKVAPGLRDGVLETLQFGGDFLGADLPAEDGPRGIAEDDHLPVGNTDGNRDAPVHPFTSWDAVGHGVDRSGKRAGGEGWEDPSFKFEGSQAQPPDVDCDSTGLRDDSGAQAGLVGGNGLFGSRRPIEADALEARAE